MKKHKAIVNFKLQTTSGTASAQEVNGAAERTFAHSTEILMESTKTERRQVLPSLEPAKTEYDNKTPEEKLKILASRKADQLLDTLYIRDMRS